jgi:hypothetical protein
VPFIARRPEYGETAAHRNLHPRSREARKILHGSLRHEWDVAAAAERPADRMYAETRCTDPDGNNIDLSVHGYELRQTKEEREEGEKVEETS